MQEIYKPLKDYEGIYEVSNLGNLRRITKSGYRYSTGSDRPMSHTTYKKICLFKDGVKKTVDMHRLVAQTFLPNPDNKPIVNHIDFNGSNNCVTNLEWVTAKENMQHSADNKSEKTVANSMKKKKETQQLNTFTKFSEQIGTEFNGRLLVGVQFVPTANETNPWSGVFKCSMCNNVFTSPIHTTISRYSQGKFQPCRSCAQKLRYKDKDIVKPV